MKHLSLYIFLLMLVFMIASCDDSSCPEPEVDDTEFSYNYTGEIEWHSGGEDTGGEIRPEDTGTGVTDTETGTEATPDAGMEADAGK